MHSKQEMDAVRQRHEQNSAQGDARNGQTAMDLEQDKAKRLLEKAWDEERKAKLNLERVLQDNYLREEEILKLNQQLLQQREKDELEIWKTKERFDECLFQTLEKRDVEIIEYKKKVEELELRIAALQTQAKDTEALELIFQDDLEALQLERNALRQTNEKYVQLISDYVRMSVLLEQRTNSQLSSSSSSSGMSSGFLRSPISGQQAEEHASSVASTADEGLEVSRCFADGLFSGSDFGAECEEAAKEASISIQHSFDRLVDAVFPSTAHSDELQRLKDLLQLSENANKDLTDLCEEYQEKLQRESSAVSRLTEQLRVKEEELRKGPKNRGDETDLISNLYRTVEDLEHRLNTAKQGETDLLKKNKELEQIIKDFEEVREDEKSMQTKFHEQLILISSLKSQLDGQKLMTNEFLEDAKNVSRWKETVELEKESSEAKDKMINDLKKELIDLEQQISGNHVELNKFRTEIEVCKKQRIDIELQLTESHKKEVTELNTTLKEKDTVLQNLMTQLQSKQNELDTLTNANSQFKHHYEAETKRLHEQLNEKQSLLEIQIDEMSSLQNQNDRNNVKISQLTDELDSSEEDLAKSRRSFEKEIEKYKDLTSKMEDDFSSLNSQLKRESEVGVEKTRQLENLEKELDRSAKELKELRKLKQQLLFQIDELEADVAKVMAKLDDGESEIKLTKEMLEENRVQMRMQLQKIEEIKRHHKKEVLDLLEDKEKELKSIHKTELEDLKRNREMDLEELKTRLGNDLEYLQKAKEKEIADLNLGHGKQMEVKEKEVMELKASHKRELDELRRYNEKELNSARSKNLEEVEEMEKSLESQQQRQIQKLKEKHREELDEMDEEIRSRQEEIEKLEKESAESAKRREVENVELKAKHAKELSECVQKIREIHEKEILTMQSELSISYKSMEEHKKGIAAVEGERSEEMRNLSEKHGRTVAELKFALETQNNEKLWNITEKHETVLDEEVKKLHTELERKISEGDNRREKEHNEAEIRRTKELKELRLTLDRQNNEHNQNISRKHEQVVFEMRDKLQKYETQVEELKLTVTETERQRDRAIREASMTLEREKDMLKTALVKDNDRHFEEILHRHRQEIECVREELARSEDSAKDSESRHRRELMEKMKEMNESSAKHVQELEALRTLLQTENEEQFNKLSGKYKQKFYELRDELEKNNNLMRETEEKQSRKAEETKNLINDVMLKNSHQLNDAIDDLKKQHAQELKEKQNQYEGDIRRLQEAVMKEKELSEERLKELISKHSIEVRELKMMHQRYIDEVTDNNRGELGDLRQSRDILEDLNAEHSRELDQLREELKHDNVALHDKFPKLETQNQTVPLQDAWKLERQCFLAEIAVFQNLLKEIGNSDESKDSESMDWRTDMLKAIHDVLTKHVNRTAVSEIYLPIISKNISQEELNTRIQKKMSELEQFYSQGLDQILAVDRKSMLDEIEDLHQQLALLQQGLLDDNKNLSDKLNGLELRFRKRQKRLKNQLNSAEAQLSEERAMQIELRSAVDVERLYVKQLEDDLNREKDLVEQLKGKISQMEMEINDSGKVLKEEQIKIIEDQFLSEQTIAKPKHEWLQSDKGYSDIIERLKLELFEEKNEHLQTKCDLAWERNQRNDLEKKVRSLWEKIGFLDTDGDLEMMLDTDFHMENPFFPYDLYYSIRREEELLVYCEKLQRLLAEYRDDLSKCSILSRDTSALKDELLSIYHSLDSLVNNEDHMGVIGTNLSSRLMTLSKRCLKAEEHLMALIYQKKYLLLLIGGFEDSERETLAAISRLGVNTQPVVKICNSGLQTPFTRFRNAVQAVIAVIRLQNLARRWDRFHGDVPRQSSSVSTWKTLTSGIGTEGWSQSFSSLPAMSFDSSLPLVGKESFVSNNQHRSRSPTSRRQAASRTTSHAFDDEVMSRSCDFGSDRLSLVYSHYPRSPSRSSIKRCRVDESGRRQRLSKRTQSPDFATSRKSPVRPNSTYLW